ncbi:hypothetical protein IZY60_01980 [Lutibacter sp. B2]|nr:hypothetical protein [Lutibacter sp. B2]
MPKRRKKQRINIIIFIISLLLVFSINKLIDGIEYVKGDNSVYFEKLHTIDYDKDNNSIVCPFGENIIVYENGKFKVYDKEGQVKCDVAEESKKMNIQSGKDLSFTSSEEVGVITARETLGNYVWSFETEALLKDFKCNERGDVALYLEEKDRTSNVVVLDNRGKQTGKITIKKGNIIDLAISEDGQMIGISVLNTENDILTSNVMLYSPKGRLLGGNTYKSEVVPFIFFTKEHRLISVEDAKITSFEKESGVLWRKKIDGNLNRVAWNKDGVIIANIIEQKKNILDTKHQNSLSLIDPSGKESMKNYIKGDIIGMSINKEIAVAFTNRTLYFLTIADNTLREKKINNDIQGVYLLEGNKLALVLKDKIEIINLKDRKE